MYRIILWFLVSILVIVIGAFGIKLYLDFNEPAFHVEESPDREKENEVVEVGRVDNKVLDEENENVYVNPFHEKYTQEELTDRHYQDYIHKMSHQKVIADTKWGFYEITDERIDWLLESLEITYDALNDGKIYRDILTKWKNDDFSRVDQDHNAIWHLQGGSIGEATGILSTEEEKEYIANTREEKGKTE